MRPAAETAPSDGRLERRRARLPAALATGGLAALLFLLAYDGGAYSTPARASVAVAVWWALFLALALGLARVRALPRAAVAVGVLLAALAALTLVSATWAPSAEGAVDEFNRVTLYLGAFLVVALASRRLGACRWLDAIALAAVAVAALALFSRFSPGSLPDRRLPELLPSAQTRLSFPVGYWNGLAILCALALPALLRVAVAASNAAVRGAAVAPVPALAAVVYLASSRGGVATAVVGALAFLALTARRWAALGALTVAGAGVAAAIAVLLDRDELVNGPLTSAAAADQGRSAALLLVVICIACALAYAGSIVLLPARIHIPAPVRWSTGVGLAVLGLAVVFALDPVARFDAFRQPPHELTIAEDDFVKAHLLSGTSSGRWQFWAAAVDEFEEHPLRGGGAGSFESWWAVHGTLATFIRDAHSLYLEQLAELGMGGLALVIAILTAGIVAGAARSRRLPGSRESTAAATATVVAFALAAGIDWMWELTIVSLVGIVALSLATAGGETAEGGGAWSRSARAAASSAVAAAALVAVATNGAALVASAHLAESQSAVARGDLVTALERAESARAVEPWAASPYLQRALVEEQAGATRAALRSVERAISRSADDWRLWLVRARLYTVAGDLGAARRSLVRAAALNPRSPLFAGVRESRP